MLEETIPDGHGISMVMVRGVISCSFSVWAFAIATSSAPMTRFNLRACQLPYHSARACIGSKTWMQVSCFWWQVDICTSGCVFQELGSTSLHLWLDRRSAGHGSCCSHVALAMASHHSKHRVTKLLSGCNRLCMSCSASALWAVIPLTMHGTCQCTRMPSVPGSNLCYQQSISTLAW